MPLKHCKRIFAVGRGLLVFLCLALSTACPRVWHFTVTDVKDFNHPIFCFSRFENCIGFGMKFSFLEIAEVNGNGKNIKTKWQIKRIEGEPIKNLTYGIVPEGYKEIVKATPLEIGKWYTVEQTFFFRFSRDGGKVTPEVHNFDGFSKKVNVENSGVVTPN